MSYKDLIIRTFQGGWTGAKLPHSGRPVPAESDQPVAPLVHQAWHPGWILKSYLLQTLFTLQVLRDNDFQPSVLRRRGEPGERESQVAPSEVLLWTNHR